MNSSLEALGVVDGLDGIDFSGTSIYKNESNPITFSHDWMLNVNKFSITHSYVPHEIDKKKTLTDHAFSGDISNIKLTQNDIINNDRRIDSGKYETIPITDDYYWWTVRSTLKGACRFYQSKGHQMTFTTNYDANDRGGSKYSETCSDAGTDIPQRTTRNWSRKMITLKLSYEVQPLSWFGKWKFPISHQIVTEAWVPPSKRVEEDKNTSTTYNPDNPSGPSENSPTPTTGEYVYCVDPLGGNLQYNPVSCGGL